jgi:hypothetical protein
LGAGNGKDQPMNMKALAILLAGALLAFAGTTLHANHLFAERSQAPDPSKGEVIEFKVKGSDRTVYITSSDRMQHWSILGAGILLFLLGAKGGALQRNRVQN